MRKQKTNESTTNWREIPFIRLLIPLILGILSAFYFDQNIQFIPWFLFAIFTLTFLISIFNQKFKLRWVFGSLAFVFLFLFGYENTRRQTDINQVDHFENFISGNDYIIGVINNVPEKKKWVRCELKVKSIGSNLENMINKIGNLLVYVEFDEKSSQLNYGDEILISTRAQEIEPPKNPEAFDFKYYMAAQNIFYQAFVRENEWAILSSDKSNPILAAAFESRSFFIKILEKHLPAQQELAVGAALILGYKNLLNPDLKEAYTGVGAMHVLAVSGLHVGIIYLILFFFLNLIKSRSLHWRISKTLILLIGVWLFALITGASASVLRAATMFSFIIIGKSIHRYTNIYNTLAISAFFLLFHNPFSSLKLT